MLRRLSVGGAILLVAVVLGFPVVDATLEGQAPSSPQAPVDLVPIDVHVVDRSGKAVTDLKQSDFTVTEDGARQQISTFAVQSPEPDPTMADTPLALRAGLSSSPQARRMFVIALGLGRLEVPSGYISALLRFVTTRLLPQDQVALFVHDRAIGLTTDRQKITAALERFKKSHEDVDFSLGMELGSTGMAPLYGTRVLPRKLQTRIDEIVLGPGAKPASLTSAEAIEREEFGRMSFDDFMASNATTLKDQDNLMALMEYLRRFEGHKDVLYVTEKGFVWPSDESDRALASVANDARASIHSLQAGGMLAAESGKELNATSQQAMSFRSLRTIAELTGGLAAITGKGQEALDRLDAMTRTGYLLGYRASNTSWDGGYRSVDVKVNRPDVTVSFRHGYYRTSVLGSFDRRSFIANSRLGAGVNFRREVNDIKIKASASQRGGTTLTVDGKVELSKVKLATLGGLRVGQLNFAVFCFDSSSGSTGMHMQVLPIQVSEEEYARLLKSGLPYDIRFPAFAGTANVRVVVYDFGSDLIGRIDTRVF